VNKIERCGAAMIQDDVAIFNQMFSVVSSGIAENYDAFTLEIVIGEGYVNRLVEVEVNGKKSTDSAGNIDGYELIFLAKQLLANATSRSEPWHGFIMSYRRGKQVQVSYQYEVGDGYHLSA
jgi:hypothetical protein